jgi:hypothetical protein
VRTGKSPRGTTYAVLAVFGFIAICLACMLWGAWPHIRF